MRVVVTGLVATYPVGGVAWDYLQYAEGLRRLGCDVLYLEDTGLWGYDPGAGTFAPSLRAGADYLASELATWMPGLVDAWSVVQADGVAYGRGPADVAAFCRSADLFLNVSGAGRLLDPYRPRGKAAFIDTDPCYNQARAAAVARGTVDVAMITSIDNMRRHDVFFTLGEHLGAPDCRVPTVGIDWKPTRQPIVREYWDVPPAADGPYSTVMSWKIEPAAPIVDGVVYGGKDVEFERFFDLPRFVPDVLEVALAGEAPRDRIRSAGWRVVDGRTVSGTMGAYREYIGVSRGELSVAKHAYVAPRTGWFSTRSAAYLASGRPAVLEDTGFSHHLPLGPGLHAFTTVDDVVRALAEIRDDYPAACAHARDVAQRCFDATTVCRRLLDDALE
jgi:hypothetical protein